MLYNEDICNLPIEKLTKENTIVAIWCTNSLSHIDAIKTDFLPKWNLKLIATWFWVKVHIFIVLLTMNSYEEQ